MISVADYQQNARDRKEAEEARVIDKLRETLPSWMDGKGIRGPQDAKPAAPSTTAPPRLEVTNSPPARLFPALPGGEIVQASGGPVPHPFKVTVEKGTGGAGDKVKILGGTFAHIQIFDKTIDAQGGFTVYLKCMITRTDPANNYRSEIGNLYFVTNAEGAVASETAGGTGLTNVTWDDPETKLTGRLYVKIADVYPAGDSFAVIQHLRNGYQTLVLSNDDVVAV